MGSASKNSWANINGVRSSSATCQQPSVISRVPHLTLRQQADILHPNNGYIKVLASTLMANICLLHSRIPAKHLFLYLPQCRTRFHQIYRLKTRRESLKVPNCLGKPFRSRNTNGNTQTTLTRSISSIKVPFPGPTSISCTPLLFRPCASHSVIVHTPTNSPNTCDISGDVMKSPFCPNTSPVSARVV